MDNNQTQNALSGFLGAIDGLRGLLIDGLNGDKLGSAPTGSIGALGAIVGIDASIDKYNNSEKTAEDFARLALDLATNLPGTSGLIASDFSFTYDGTQALIQWANKKYAGGLTLGDVVYDWTHPPIDPAAKSNKDAASQWILRRDPLTLDLDGDGLETTGVAATNPIQFDHDGDGIKNGTGWVKPDDAFLVLDKNGNGSIDNGRELFGDNTIKSNGQTAKDGFDALADLDKVTNGGNADGIVNASDTQFKNLRLWRDLNQDGISQTGELLTLASQNITGINVAKTANSQTIANGNQIADLGTFTKTDGSIGGVGAVTGNLADINLAEDTFHRTFPNVLDTTSIATLPDMQGSGKVRDLREAATQSTTLQNLLTQYSTATTRTAQLALLDQLLDAWADTGGMAESLDARVASMQGYTKADGTVIPYTLTSNLTAEWQQKLHIIETFNGAYFFGLPNTSQTAGAVTGLTIATPTVTSSSVQITVNLIQQQIDLLQQSYDAIKISIYDALLLQTRFKPILDQIDLVIDANGISLDFKGVNGIFDAKIKSSQTNGLIDLIEFNAVTREMLSVNTWNGWENLAGILAKVTPTQDVISVLRERNILALGVDSFNGFNATSKNDIILGNDAANILYGGLGDDLIFGGAGDDWLEGGIGSDTYIFGKTSGNDIIKESLDFFKSINRDIDTLLLDAGITPADVTVKRDGKGYDLLLTIAGANNQLRIENYFYGDSKSAFSIEQIKFAEGTTWDVASIKAKLIQGTAGNDILVGYDGADVMIGLAGDDTLEGQDGSDTYLFGRTSGSDVIEESIDFKATDLVLLDVGIAPADVTVKRDGKGGDLLLTIEGAANQLRIKNFFFQDAAYFYGIEQTKFADGTIWDVATIKAKVIQGTSGNDIIVGYAGADVMNGLAGDDILNGMGGSDTYLFGKASGNDIIEEGYDFYANTDKVILDAGITPDNVTVKRDGKGYDLLLTIAGATNKLRIKSFFYLDGITPFAIGQIKFSDGTIWDLATIKAKVMQGTAGNDILVGYAGADVMNGLAGDDILNGLSGNDTYLFGKTSGNDIIEESLDFNANTDTVLLDAGIAPADVSVKRDGAGYDLLLTIAGATNQLRIKNYFANDSKGLFSVEQIKFSDGTIWSMDTINARVIQGTAGNDTLVGYAGADLLNGLLGDDTLDGQGGNDTMLGGLGNDTYTIDSTGDVVTEGASAGSDTVNVAIATASGTYTVAANVENAFLTNTIAYNLIGNALANFLKGNAASNTLTDAIGGNDILQGLAGIDNLNDTVGNNLFDGGVGNDVMAGGSGREIFIGGKGNDIITTGTGYDIVSFNKGDGKDTINASTGTDNTLSLGGKFAYTDLSLTKFTNDLILKMGTTDQITLKDWYLSSSTNKSVINLQVVAEAIQGFTLGGVDQLRNNKIENFNFTNLVAAFDAAGATANWQLTDTRLTTHLLAGSDSAAIGGDLAYQYGKNSNLTGMGLINAQSVIAAASFGQTAQTLNNPSVWQAELVKLG